MFVFIFGFGNDAQYIHEFLKQFSEIPKQVILYEPGITFQEIENIIFSLPTQKISLVGFSLGSIIALQFSEKYPSFIEKLILLGIPSYSHLIFQRKWFKLMLIDTCIFLFRICPYSSRRVKRSIYKLINKNSPDCVIKNVINFDWVDAMLDLKHFLFGLDITKMILTSKHRIHIFYGQLDEFVNYGFFLDSIANNLCLHMCEGDHHFIYKESSLLANKIKYICKNNDAYV
jgi:pimeloyl-ACP methyl ester carboxylesterase